MSPPATATAPHISNAPEHSTAYYFIEGLNELVELGQVHAAALLTTGEQCGHLWA